MTTSSQQAAGPRRDPRETITPDALHVAPELLGLPLARPWRRGVAMLVDLCVVGILANAPSVLFGIAAAIVLLRVSLRPKPGAGHLSRAFRLFARAGAAVVLFGLAVAGWGSVSRRVADVLDDGPQVAAVPDQGPHVAAMIQPGDRPDVQLQGLKGVRTLARIVAFRQSGDSVQARERAVAAVAEMRAAGLADGAIDEALSGEAVSAPDRPWLNDAVRFALRDGAAEAAPAEPAPDSLALAYAAALRQGDSARAGSLRPRVAGALARDSLDALHGQVADLQRENRTLGARVGELESKAESRSLVSRLKTLVTEDLGLGLGWIGLYFTAMLALFQGRTLGKRLLGIRVIRLNGRPMGWWASFERFGGYAAGFATGLLGFFQIYWDDNRQAIHDRIAETAVIRD